MAMPSGSAQWPESVRAVAARCPRELTQDECYQRLSGLGLQYGPEFRGLVHLAVGQREAVGVLHCPSGKSGPYQLPPNLLDSGLQALAMLTALEPGPQDGTSLPATVRSIKVRGALKDRAFCHATLEENGAKGTWVGRVKLYDVDGALAVDVEGLLLRPAGDALSAGDWAKDRVYQMAWEPRGKSAPPAPTEPWLWIFPSESAAREAMEALESVGRTEDPVVAWPRGEPPRAISSGALALPAGGAGWEEVLDRTGVERAVWVAAPVHPEELASECERVLALCQGAARSKASRLLVVTHGAHDAAAPEPAQAAIWGLLRTYAREHPDRWGGLLDLPPDARADAGRAVTFAMQAADAELAVRGGVAHEPRLKRAAPPAPAAPSFRSDATYLLAGGLGGVGLKLAQWMAGRGARNLVLLGRRAPSADAAAALSALERRGVRLRAIQGDVSRPEDVQRALAEPAAQGWPAVRGVFMLAAALADGVMHALDGARLRVPLEAKVSGGWNLHRATAGLELDHFVLFSSVAALGTPGQAGYAAANAFLDALAHRRRADRLPALSLGFGAFAEIGAAARLEQSGGRGAAGVESMPPERALEAMGALLSAAEPHAIVGNFSWTAFASGVAPGAAQLYRALVETAAEPSTVSEAPAPEAAIQKFPTWLRTQAKLPRVEALVEHLKEEAANLLGLPIEQAPARDMPLMQAGVDSLMAVHLRNKLSASLGVGLTATVVFDYPTINHLAEYLATLLEPEAADPASAKPSESLEAMLTELEQLPEEEVERRLRKGK